MRWTREEYIAHLTGEYTGKEFFTELFGPLVGLCQEWESQGASKAEQDLSAFGWDYVPHEFVGNCGAITGLEEKILEETDLHILSTDTMGRTQKLMKGRASVALPLSYPVKNFDDWKKIKHWYDFSEERVDKEELLRIKKLQDKGCLTVIYVPGGFDEPRQLLGEEELCVAYYDQPELIEDMLNTIGQNVLKVIERISDVLTIDNIFIHEDMAGKSGPLAGPLQVDEFIAPYYQKIWSEASRHGSKLFSQDSDGNMNPVMDNFIRAGVNIFYPFEPGSYMDIVETRKKYGKQFAIKGGINKYVLMEDKEAIKKELEYKICDLTKGGGIIFGLDHRIPNGVPIENYRFYVDYARQLLGLPKKEAEDFVRMAF